MHPTLAAGLDSFKVLYGGMQAQQSFMPSAVPDYTQFVMTPPTTEDMVQWDAKSKPDGHIQFELADYHTAWHSWVRGTDHAPQRGGWQGVFRMESEWFHTTEELAIAEFAQFTDPGTTTAQAKAMRLTMQGIISKMVEARDRLIREKVLDLTVIPPDGLLVWDGEPQFSDNHIMPDQNEKKFSNILIGGTPVVHNTELTPPTRIDVLNPTMAELYQEALFFQAYFTRIRARLDKYTKDDQEPGLEIICRDMKTYTMFLRLNKIDAHKFDDENMAENQANSVKGLLSPIMTNIAPEGGWPVGAEIDYVVVPRQGDIPGEMVQNIGEQPIWTPYPRAVGLAVPKPAFSMPMLVNYDQQAVWKADRTGKFGFVEQQFWSLGFASEVCTFRPVQLVP